MGIHFITVLGTSLYENCTYAIDEGDFTYTTPFVQMAALKYITSAYGECDRITVFVTESSEENNWYTREYTDREKKKFEERQIVLKPGEVKIGLKEMMETAFPKADIECVRIREGRNKKEIDEIFECMYDAILPDETIYFDFTHGLRNIPMQALTVIHYAKILKNIQVGGIYYGAFELGEDRKGSSRYVQLLDMSACSTILDWTSAAESFIKGGSSNQIKKLYKERVKPGREEQYSTKTLERLCDLTNCLNTSRGKAGKNGRSSIQKAYEHFKENYDKMRKGMTRISEMPLLRLFDKIEKDVEIFDRKCYLVKDNRKIYLENTATGAAAVEWAISKGLTQQGFTALEETIKTYICEAYEISAEEETTRDMVVGSTVKLMARQYNEAKKEHVVLDINQLKEKRREELWNSSQFLKLNNAEQEFYIQKVDEIIDHLSLDLVNLTSMSTIYRNTLNHFGFQKEEIDYVKLQAKLQELYKQLQKIMEMEQVLWE